MKKRALLACLIPIAVLPATSWGQEEQEDEVFELSPFEVNVANDRGYLSTNAISGTSLNTPIRDLPMPLEVINQELIEDLQATDLEESLEYSAGVYTQSFQNNSGANESSFSDNSPSAAGMNSAFSNTISLRGYTVPNNQRFGFRVGAIVPRYNVVLGGSTDTVTAERVEVVRGPQALLYGINVLSGIVNIIPKEPLFDPAYRSELSAGSYGYRRASLDLTGPLIRDKLAYRFLTAYTEEGHWTMFNETEREDYALQLKWRMSPRYDLFVEVKRSNFLNSGIGAKYFTDDDPAGISKFSWANEWNERITFGRDDITQSIVSDRGTVFENPWVPRPDIEYPEKLYDLGNNFRISGPDTYFDRKEETITGLLRAKFTDNLNGEFGVYRVKQEEEVFNVDLRTFNGSRGPVRPTPAPEARFGNPPTQNNVTPAMDLWFKNPEVNLDGTRGPLEAYADEAYTIGHSVGEAFVFPSYTTPGQLYPSQLPPETPQMFDDPKSTSWNRRYARYAWYKDFNEAESIQLRARLAYTFDKDLLGIPANHTLSVGANYIGDIIGFNDASVGNNNDNFIYSSFQPKPELSKLGSDPYYFRKSVLDFTPMRYNGETIAILASPNFNRLADFKTGGASGTLGSTIARSGKKEATLWYRGMYGLYQGRFWEEKLHVIAGMREDQYQVKETEDLMIIDQLRVTDIWQGSVDPLTPWFIGDGRGEYQSPDGIPDELDARVREDYATLQEMQPNGTTEYNFDDYQKFTTGTAGFSFRIIDPVSVYYLFSEGVFPNTGQRDGAYRPIDAEQTINNEIGFKFDLLDGKISGTVSFYRIERENAVHYWENAPAPARWHGGPLAPVSLNEASSFSPQAATGPGSPYYGSREYPVSYSVAMDYVEQAFDELGMSDEFPDVAQADAFTKWGAGEITSGHMQGAVYHPFDRMILNVEYDVLKNAPEAEVLRRAFEIAQASEDPISFPFNWWSFGNFYVNNSPSNSGGAGANVTFSEVGEGLDGQLIFSPTPNYQVMFSYSYQNREVTNFNLVDAVDLETGINWGTEYDIWVYLLGEENFTDPTRPSTFTGGSVKGLDLSFTPKFSGKLWNMYRFSEGPLEGFRIGGGVQYIGTAPTSVSIGGNRLTTNLYRTPDSPERFIFDMSASYKWTWADVDWFLSLRVANLLDDREDTVKVTYDTVLNTQEKRRTRLYYAPRTWRLSLTARF